MSKWVGYAVSVNCGAPLGCYQGTILDTDENTITLSKVFRNGFPYPKSQVTLNATDIKDLKIIEEPRPSGTEQTHSTVVVVKRNKKCPRTTVCENQQPNPSHSSVQQNSNHVNNKTVALRGARQPVTRSKSIDVQGSKNKNHHTGAYSAGAPSSQGKARPHERARCRSSANFGDAAEPAFNFEGNLAFFDKQVPWEERRSMSLMRPDVIPPSFRQNVPGLPPPQHIRVPDELRGPNTASERTCYYAGSLRCSTLCYATSCRRNSARAAR